VESIQLYRQTSRKLRSLRTVWYRKPQISHASVLAVLSQRSIHDRCTRPTVPRHLHGDNSVSRAPVSWQIRQIGLLATLQTQHSTLLVRPPDRHTCRRYRFYWSSSFYWGSSSFFFRHVPSELAERNSTKIGHMLGSKTNAIWRRIFEMWGMPLQIEGPKTLCSTTPQLNGNSNGLYLLIETW